MFWNSPPNVNQRVCVITHAFGRPVVPESPHQSPSRPISYPHVRVITHARGTQVRLPTELSLGSAAHRWPPLPRRRIDSVGTNVSTDAPLPLWATGRVSSADVGRAGEDRSERQRRRQKADRVRSAKAERPTCVGGGAVCGGAQPTG